MYLSKAKITPKKYERKIETWAGLNQNALIGDNQFSSVTNMSTKNFPYPSPRGSRETSYTLTSGKALFSSPSYLAWVDGTSFKYNNTTKGSVTSSAKSMVDFNGRIGIFPDLKTYDYVNDSFATMQGQCKLLKYGYDSNGDVDYTLDTRIRSQNYLIVTPSTSYTLTNDKSYSSARAFYFDSGQNFISTATIDFSSFTTPATCYYMLFDITGTNLEAVVRLTNAVYPCESSIPNIDYATVSENRVWGVKEDTIYATALGDINNWTTYSTPSVATDSWYTDTGTGGDFTGVTTYRKAVFAFKKDLMLKLFGDIPSNFQFLKVTNLGCIDNKSIREVNNTLYFLGEQGVYEYTGGLPVLISQELNETYTSGIAGSDNRYYYLCLYNGSKYNLYVFDTRYRVWSREDDLQVKEFTYLNGYVYALTATKVIKFNSGSEIVDMVLISKEFTDQTFIKKHTNEICVRTDLNPGTRFAVSKRTDNGSFISIKDNYTYSDTNSFRIPIATSNADHFQLKFEMIGDGKLLNMERTIAYGGK